MNAARLTLHTTASELAPRDVTALWHVAFAMLVFGSALVLGGLIMGGLPHAARGIVGVVAVGCGFGASMHMLGTALRLLNHGSLLPPVRLPLAPFTPRVAVLTRA